MLVVLLRDLSRIDVVLNGSTWSAESTFIAHATTYLNDLFVGHSGEEDILLIFVGMEPNDVRDLSVAKPFEALTCLRVPQLHLTIITTGEEPATIVREANVLDGFDMAHESS